MNTPQTWSDSPIHEQIRKMNDTPRTDHVVKKSDQKDAEMAFAIMTDHADCLERELTIVTAQWDRAREELAAVTEQRDEAREQLEAAKNRKSLIKRPRLLLSFLNTISAVSSCESAKTSFNARSNMNSKSCTRSNVMPICAKTSSELSPSSGSSFMDNANVHPPL